MSILLECPGYIHVIHYIYIDDSFWASLRCKAHNDDDDDDDDVDVSWRSDWGDCNWPTGVHQRREQAPCSVHRTTTVPLLLRRIVHPLLRPQDHPKLRQGKACRSARRGTAGVESCASCGWTAARWAWCPREETVEQLQGRSGTRDCHVRISKCHWCWRTEYDI